MKNFPDLVIFSKVSTIINKEIILYSNSYSEKSERQLLKKKLKNKKVIIAEPYRAESNQVKIDQDYLFICYKFFLKSLIKNLNTIHQTNHDRRYWEIIIGHWLRTFLATTFNRYKTLIKIKKKYNIKNVEIFDDSKFSEGINDSFDLNNLSKNELFNFILVSSIIKEAKIFDYKYIKKNFKIMLPFQSRLKPKTNIFKNFLSHFSSDTYLSATYLPYKADFLLKLFVNNFSTPEFEINKFSNEVKNHQFKERNKLKIIIKNDDPFVLLISKLLKNFLPLSFIENYENFKNEILKNKYLKKKRKTIFTSNNFGASDKHNIWLAEKVFEGSKYIVGQHGCGYLEDYDKYHRVEFRTCDKFISWGNKVFSKKIKPLFNFKMLGRNLHSKKNGKILIVCSSTGQPTMSYDRWDLGNNIYVKTENLIKKFDKNLKKNVILKLHNNHKKDIYPQFDKFLNSQKNIVIKQNESFYRVIKKSRLVLFNRYSSGFLECLSIDFPTICLFANKLAFIHQSNIRDYEILVENNLIFFDEIKLATFVNDNFDNIELWWHSERIKKIKKNFCIKYSNKCYKDYFKNFKEFSSLIS